MATVNPRLMALDLGSRRTGVATSDELAMFAHPRTAFTGDEASTIDSVVTFVEDESVDEVVVGLPLTLSGGDSDQTRWVRDMADRLRTRLSVPVTFWDERLSTVEAKQEGRKAAKGSRTDLDSRAAALVLQAVLDARRGGAGQ